MTQLSAFLVEDSPVIRESLIGALQELTPVRVMGCAEDEVSALAWLEHHECDLLIIDIFLKTGSGLGVLQAARDLGTAGKLIVLSNFATADIRQGCTRLGADRVFDKSCEIDDLVKYCGRLAA